MNSVCPRTINSLDANRASPTSAITMVPSSSDSLSRRTNRVVVMAASGTSVKGPAAAAGLIGSVRCAALGLARASTRRKSSSSTW